MALMLPFRLTGPARICMRLSAFFFTMGATPFQFAAAAQAVDWRGTVETEIALGLRHGGTQKSDFIFRPEITGELSSWGSFTVIGQLRLDPADNLEPGRPFLSNESRGSFSRRGLIGSDLDVELREAYLDIYAGDAFWRIGKQQVVWGQADGLRVLDAVNPLHFREFILGDLEHRRIPLWMVNYERPVGEATLQLLWIPDHTYNDLPASGVFAFNSPHFAPALPEECDCTISSRLPRRPSRLFQDDDFGARLTGFSNGWDWSINYLYSYADSPVARREMIDLNSVTLTPEYARTHLVGGSASNAFGDTTIRLELGWLSDSVLTIGDPTDADGVTSAQELSYVFGADYQFDGDTFLSAQLIQSHILDHPSQATRQRTETQVSLLSRREFMNDTLEAEALLIASADNGDGVLQLSINYELSDAVSIGVKVDDFFGDRNGLFGQFESADRIVFRMGYGF